MNELEKLRCELLVEKAKNNIYKQLIEQKFGITLTDDFVINKEQQSVHQTLSQLLGFIKILLNENIGQSQKHSDELNEDKHDDASPIKPKKITYRSIRSIGKHIIQLDDTIKPNSHDITNETSSRLIESHTTESHSEIDDSNKIVQVIQENFEQLKTSRQYKKFIDIIRNERQKLMKLIPYSEFIQIIQEHIMVFTAILTDKKYDQKKIKSILDTILSPLEMRLIFFGNYTQTFVEIDDIQRFNEAFDLNIKKEYVVFNQSKLNSYFNNYRCAIMPINECIKNILFHKFGFNNIIYVKLPKSVDDDPYSFYILEKIMEDNKRCWKMDCRLEDLSSELIHSARSHMIRLFRQIYSDIFHDNNYRHDYIAQSKCQIAECECQQLLQNICFMVDLTGFMKFLQYLVKDNTTYVPTKLDKFNLLGDDVTQKKRLKNQVFTDENIISVIKTVFDDISSVDALSVYKIHSQKK